MNILFIHQNFPGQFRHLAIELAKQPEHRVLAIGQAQAPGLPGVKLIRYKPSRAPAKTTHHYLHGFERGVLAGQQVIRILLTLQTQGFTPDVIIAHPGWGEALYVKDVFPQAKVIHFCEYYYHTEGADAGFDPNHPLSLDDKARIRTRNALHLLNLEQCDIAVTPTQWQKSLHPTSYQHKIQVIHEGIDTQAASPNPHAQFTLPNGQMLTSADPVLTYVARNLEPYRGFPQFIRALSLIQQQHPTVQTLIVGGDEVSYGSKPTDAKNWREKMLQEVNLDANRVHFLGKLPYRDYLTVLQISRAHVYLTYPFVLSWSLLEALSAGCCVIASNTAPVQEVITHRHNGLLVDFFDEKQLIDTTIRTLNEPERYADIRNNARKTVMPEYGVKLGVDRWLQLLRG